MKLDEIKKRSAHFQNMKYILLWGCHSYDIIIIH